jgi:hypothetical protein
MADSHDSHAPKSGASGGKGSKVGFPKGTGWAVLIIIVGLAVLFLIPSLSRHGQGGGPGYNNTGYQQVTAPQLTPECPGKVIHAASQGAGDIFNITDEDCQVRVHIKKTSPGKTATLYDEDGNEIGTASAGTQDTTDEIIHKLSSDGNELLLADVTLCPLGSLGTNIGSCN